MEGWKVQEVLCLETEEMTKSLEKIIFFPRDLGVFHVYRHFPYSRYFVISPVYRHHILKSV